MNVFIMLLLALLASACTPPAVVRECGGEKAAGRECPPAEAVEDAFVDEVYEMRTWKPQRGLGFDPIRLGEQVTIPVNDAYARTLGPFLDDALKSLAAKIWLIEHAQHTVDVMYYIFARDRVGYAIIGALCDAVKRGVDVRIMVDSMGSFHPSHPELRALASCAREAGFVRNARGEVTTRRARVQAMIFNSMWKLEINRRSHDKLLVIDGSFPDTATVMTGGRNVSLDYYGIHEDGSIDPTAFRDMEIVIRSNPDSRPEETVGWVTERYYSLLFLHRGNRRLLPMEDVAGETRVQDAYDAELKKARESLAFLKQLPILQERFAAMPDFMDRQKGFHRTLVRLSHQLSNLDAVDVATSAEELVERNPNSIMHLIFQLAEESFRKGIYDKHIRIVSPYLFIGLYRDKEGKVIHDGAKVIRQLAAERPDAKVEIITNSVLTSDNFMTQALIDMSMIPRLLLPAELMKRWQAGLEEGEFNPAVVESPAWRSATQNPQLLVYQTGRADAVLLGGKQHYGKLHAKFIVGDRGGFIGTSNFDYRSNTGLIAR